MTKYVAGLLFSEDGKSIALIVKNKPDWQKGLLNGIGGKVEDKDYFYPTLPTTKLSDNMASFIAMSREFEEETGVSINCDKWELFLNIQRSPENDIKKEGFSVDFYRAFSDDVFKVSTITDEAVVVRNICDLHSLNTIENLKWIILLALDKNPKFTKTEY